MVAYPNGEGNSCLARMGHLGCCVSPFYYGVVSPCHPQYMQSRRKNAYQQGTDLSP